MKDIIHASFFNHACFIVLFFWQNSQSAVEKKAMLKNSRGTGRIKVCIFSPQYLNQMDLEMVDQGSSLAKHTAFDDKVTRNMLP